jgi:hypothetical protein
MIGSCDSKYTVSSSLKTKGIQFACSTSSIGLAADEDEKKIASIQLTDPLNSCQPKMSMIRYQHVKQTTTCHIMT